MDDAVAMELDRTQFYFSEILACPFEGTSHMKLSQHRFPSVVQETKVQIAPRDQGQLR